MTKTAKSENGLQSSDHVSALSPDCGDVPRAGADPVKDPGSALDAATSTSSPTGRSRSRYAASRTSQKPRKRKMGSRGLAVAAVYDRRRCRNFGITGGHRPPLQRLSTPFYSDARQAFQTLLLPPHSRCCFRNFWAKSSYGVWAEEI